MRNVKVGFVIGALLVAATATAATAQAPPTPEEGSAIEQFLELGGQIAPKAPPAETAQGKAPAGANPYLALLPDPAAADYAGWARFLETRGDRRQAQRRPGASPLLVDEDEPIGTRGANDTLDTAQPVEGFGTGRRQNPRLRFIGSLSPDPIAVEAVPPNAEDDGAIPLAAETGIGTTRQGITTSGVIGDGPHGSAGSGTGDFDWYAVDLLAGQVLTVDVDTPAPSDLDTIVVLWDADGTPIALNDDNIAAGESDSLLVFRAETTARYYVLVSDSFAFQPDPQDPGSGFGVGNEGPYDVTITAGAGDDDVLAVQLRKGDVLGATVAGNAFQLGIFDPAGTLVMGSAQDASGAYPAQSPLPGGGNATADHVVDEDGWHYIGVRAGSGAYDITVEVYRPRLATEGPVQTLFLDFDGARLNTNIFGGPGVRQLSPLRSFLAGWGLRNRDLDPLIDRIVATVRENVSRDLVASGLAGTKVKILNSRDDADPFGKPHVSRLIIGGTIDQSGIPTIGIAQSIDPGNFATEETALILLDVLSAPPGVYGDETDDPSLNAYLTPASDRVGFVGRAVGNIASHEAGHFFGDWHVDQFNDVANLMDQGGNPALIFGVGPDRVGGTGDDVDVDFGEDELNPNEGFVGIEDTLSRLALALVQRSAAPSAALGDS